MHYLKKLTDKLIVVVLATIMATAMLFGAFFVSNRALASADGDDDTKEFQPTALGISNPDFSETSGSYPASPTSWTGSAVGSGKGNVVTGVVDLTTSEYLKSGAGNKEFKLDQYPEYSTEAAVPHTIFGGDEYREHEGTDKKTLLVNTAEGAEVAYSYTSSDLSFAANSFYRVSAWVKTGDFKSGTGATIKLSGLGENCAFTNINTVKSLAKDSAGVPVLNKANNYGWVKYTFYVRTSASLSKTVKLGLGIGDALTDSDEDAVSARPASGYAFFDTVSADRISSYDFAYLTSNFKPSTERENVYYDKTGTSMMLDLYEVDILTYKGKDIGTFSGLNASTDLSSDSGWNSEAVYDEDSDDRIYQGQASVRIYDSSRRVDIDDNDFNLTKNPWAPLGKAEYEINDSYLGGGSDGNILMISANNGVAARGVASPEYTIKRFGYYRFSVWVKGDGVTEGAGISIGVKGEAHNTANNNKLARWFSSLSGDSADTAHYGWKEQVVYIVGSALSDLNVHFELWLGSPNSQSRGIAMFDNVTFTELSYSDYVAMSGADGGNAVTLDASGTASNIANGKFMSVGDYEEFKYPLPAANWTLYSASEVTSTGFSKDTVDTDNVIYGIIPTDDETFAAEKKKGTIPGIVNPKTFANGPLYNTAFISSSTPTAVCYQSTSLSATASTAYKITATIAVDGVSENGYGASLVLKTTDGSVIATIENIKSTYNKFETYTFYLDTLPAEKSLYLELWLGLNDRVNNSQKLSDGNLYIKEVDMLTWEAAEGSTIESEYSELLSSYKTDTSSPAGLRSVKYAVYSFNTPSFDYYDVYGYANGDELGRLYQWGSLALRPESVHMGIYDAANMSATLPYANFDAKDQTGNMLVIQNTVPNFVILTAENSFSVAAETYARLEITLKVRLTDEDRLDKTSVGAGISLTGTSTESFTNIKDTTTLVMAENEDSRDYETFKTFTFYIKGGSEGGSVGLAFSLGDTTRSKYIQGTLIVSDIEFTTINNTAYDNAVADLDGDYEKSVVLSEDTTDDEGNDSDESGSENTGSPTSGDIQWWIIPTVIFSAALIIILIIVMVVMIRSRVKRKAKKVYASEYDRETALKHIDKINAADEKKANTGAEYTDSDDRTDEPQEQAKTDDTEPEADAQSDAEPETPDSLDD